MRKSKITTKSPLKIMAFYLLLSVVFLCGCSKGEHHAPIIVAKSYQTFLGGDMPKGICRYYVKEWENVDALEFQDSCGMYNVGDTLLGGKKYY